MPRRPARPVSWVNSPGVNPTCPVPSNFSSFSTTTHRAGMLMPKQVFPWRRRPSPAPLRTVVRQFGGRAPPCQHDAARILLQGEAELREMQSLQILLTELAFDHLIDDTADATHLVIGGEFESGVDALFDGLIASVAGEDEIDAGRMPRKFNSSITAQRRGVWRSGLREWSFHLPPLPPFRLSGRCSPYVSRPCGRADRACSPAGR